MKWTVASGGQFVKRLSQPLEFRRDISLYGQSNLYPQMVNEVMFRSPITLAAVNALGDFTNGAGFQFNGDLIVNDNEQTINDILRSVSAEYATFDGFALHFNVNELGMITEITSVDFPYVRYGLPDEDGIHLDVKVNPNWEKDPNKTLSRTIENIAAFPLWQRRDAAEIEDIEDFQGFILYWTPVIDQYPKATFDAVIDSAQTNGEIQVFELGNIQNGFQSASFYLHRGKIESEAERRRIMAELASMKGAENANSVGLLEVPVDFDSNILETVAANNNDRLFELTNDNSMERIIANYGMPSPILGIQPDGGLFNQEQLEDAFVYYNLRTKDRRTTLEDVFNRFMRFWAGGEVKLGEIIENEFIKKTEAGTEDADDVDSAEGVDKTRVETEGKSEAELASQAGLRGSVGGVNGILAIQTAVQEGITDRDAAIVMLVEIYGFTEEVAEKILGDVVEKTEEDGGDTTDN